MRKYYLFIIKKEYVKLYKNKSYILYKILEKLYNMDYEYTYGINIYNQLCDRVSKKLLNNYINSRIKHTRKNKLIIINKTYLEIKYSCIIIYTNKKNNNIFKIFNIYNSNIFICDFKNKDYFWLNEYLNRKI